MEHTYVRGIGIMKVSFKICCKNISSLFFYIMALKDAVNIGQDQIKQKMLAAMYFEYYTSQV